MSTRGTYIFKDAKGDHAQSFVVYRHCDNYPTGAAQALTDARKVAWQGARFEADEAGASFIAANKKHEGGVRLLHGTGIESAACDSAYVYIVSPKGNDWHVECRVCLAAFWDAPVLKNTRRLFAGTIAAFTTWAEENRAHYG